MSEQAAAADSRPEVEVDADTNLMSPPAKVVRDAELSAEQRRDAAFATPLLAFALAS